MPSRETSRREFLRQAGGGLVAVGVGSQLGWLAGCGGDEPSAADWAALKRDIGDRLLLPDSAGYERARIPYNRRYANVRPGGIAICEDARDVTKSVHWAREN
ncbi:MAG: twin-arginine translocation pathway signal protein, partial [Thermoleophilaceae bacterium]|nr:twin-arginine translocation pathway signal protein [Thermoleophilaceae bacterium]